MTTASRALVALALVACARSEPDAIDQGSSPSATPRFPALSGAWTGGAQETPYGPARATLFIGDEGWGSVSVLAQGNVVSRRFRVLAWDGGRAELESEGQRHTVGLRLDGARLLVDVPAVGVVVLVKTGERR